MKNILPLLLILVLTGCKKNLNSNLIYEGEKHFKNVKQMKLLKQQQSRKVRQKKS